ncbi:MAG: hypothetical protein K1Y01_05210 [Vicinamibacteria bacterium]|nr:hypothetical protein [Vicinamibacteria bacterium]
MNPLKNLFNKVFDQTPPQSPADAPREDAAFEWNPDQETVAPTTVRSTSWKRGDTPDEAPHRAPGEATNADIAAAAQSLPAPTFEKAAPRASQPDETVVTVQSEPPAPIRTITPPPSAAAASPAARVSSDNWVKPSIPDTPAPPPAPPVPVPTAQSLVPLSDFEEVYRKAGIKSPVHGYGVERVYRLLTSRRLVGLDRNVRRSALLTALDAAGVPASDVSQDAVLRRKALTAYEAEKALELQSLRSRNESRAEALQDTIETFTRQKQSQIERLAQGSTSAVRAQSDLEIRKRMEQDRLYRSLAYFVEPLPAVTAEARPAFPETPRVIERFDATIEMRPLTREEQPSPVPEAAAQPEPPAPPVESVGADTRPLSQTGLEMALRAAAEEARSAGWGKTAVVEDSAATDAVDSLRKLREAKKTESES